MTSQNQPAASCCSTSQTNPAADDHGKKNLLGEGQGGGQGAEMTRCPVMAGTPVDVAVAEAAGLYRDYEGQRYHFCCAGCGPAFDADPAKYAATTA